MRNEFTHELLELVTEQEAHEWFSIIPGEGWSPPHSGKRRYSLRGRRRRSAEAAKPQVNVSRTDGCDLAEPNYQCIPHPTEAPSSELRVGRAPESITGRQLPPRRTGAKDVEEGFQMQRHDFGSAPYSSGPVSLHYRINEEALSRRAVCRLRDSLLNLAPS